ncbi:MAG: ClbS/DfsB family four-helix bundle protein [Streptococcus agalactiae]|nr:ClbS/DfsB family four-helix bundle protein [Streptococcus agalactiae]
MRTYYNKEELKAEIEKTFEKYISEFDNIPENLKDKRVDEVDRTPAENLSYQVGWTSLVLKWEEDERKGLHSIYAMIDSLSEEELFKPHMRKWADEATKTATWEVYKFIHVNTVAPFGTFRTKIRKWKKIVL